jgi:transcriptional regulator with XRE-family HTH domain
LERGWTQEDAAERLNIALRHYKRLEAGANITVLTAARVAIAFGVAVADLFVPPRSMVKRKPGRPRKPSA